MSAAYHLHYPLLTTPPLRPQSHLYRLATQPDSAVPARESGACAVVAYLVGDQLTVAGAGAWPRARKRDPGLLQASYQPPYHPA